MVSRRGTGGVVDCGALEEDGPVTCETLAFPGGPIRWARRPGNQPPMRRWPVRRRPAEPEGSAKNKHHAHGAGASKGRPET